MGFVDPDTGELVPDPNMDFTVEPDPWDPGGTELNPQPLPPSDELSDLFDFVNPFADDTPDTPFDVEPTPEMDYTDPMEQGGEDYIASDRRLKQAITALEDPLGALRRLAG